MHILDKIVAHKKIEVASRKKTISAASLESAEQFSRNTRSLATSLRQSNTGIIAEFKRRSPSKPSINLTAKASQIVTHYAQAGVCGISVLTDNHFFGGGLDDLVDARRTVDTPLLRKEFIIDEYQILEAKAYGADAILLITKILTKVEVAKFSSLARSLGLETLLEIHTKEQLEKYCEDIDIIGVNNRDLTTFTVDPEHSVRLFDSLPKNVVKISESGIHDPTTIGMLRKIGYEGFLIGERFMKTLDPGKACQQFINELTIRV